MATPRITDVNSSYKIAKTDNPYYLIDIWCPGHNLGIQVDMPEQLNIATSSDWESRLPSSIAQAWSAVSPLGGGATEAVTNVLGFNPIVQGLTFQMWTGTSPVEIPLTVLFDAERSGLKDVYEPIVKLQSLIFPVHNSLGLLAPPGPDVGLWSDSEGGYGIHVKIGRMMMFINCILVSANAIFDARLDNRGYPISGQIDLVFRTPIVYGHKDWMAAMGYEG